MIYVCVPVHNEARTAGLVLWKVRQVFTGFSREYHILVCDDASTDETAEVLGRYARVLPMTVITNQERQGYAKSLEALLMAALQRTDRPKRDCAITLHADFVHSPDAMEEMVKRLESGADLVVGEQKQHAGAVKRGFRWCRAWAPRLLHVPGVRDTVSGFLALRLVVLRQALRPGAETLLTTDGWAANAELVARLIRHARKLETVGYSARYDLRQRESRTTGLDELLRAWRARPAVRAARLALLATLMLFAAPRAGAQTAPAADSNAGAPATRPVPFPIGEHLVFQAKYGFISVGTATMDVSNLDTIRGTPTVHLVFHILGSALFGAYKLDQKLESWVGKDDFVSRRYKVDTDEKGKRWGHTYDIFPDSGYYRSDGTDTTHASVPNPLDDAAFLYWIRTVPLEDGKKYEYRRYFRPENDPIIVEVVGHDRVSVAGRKWNAIVVRPAIPNGRGIFAEKADARIWLSDDSTRTLLALQSTFSFGQVTLKLKEYSVPEHQ
ncbi:MAG TPA: DUF3108 domain-containing protein [Gemmatimonadales bacterium]|nr:DUF3108 domain-containing protein [Gemmatimonadales bacterium]